MRFPLDKHIVTLDAQGHVKQNRGIATDYEAVYTTLYAPFYGNVETYFGPEGGNWLRLTRPNGDKLEFAHLSAYSVKSGIVQEGAVLATTGNTGAITTGPHLHIQIFVDNQRVDPEKYFNNGGVAPPTSDMNVTQSQVDKLYKLGFKRPADAGAQSWVGQPLDTVLDGLIGSKENTEYTKIFTAVKAMENDVRSGNF